MGAGKTECCSGEIDQSLQGSAELSPRVYPHLVRHSKAIDGVSRGVAILLLCIRQLSSLVPELRGTTYPWTRTAAVAEEEDRPSGSSPTTTFGIVHQRSGRGKKAGTFSCTRSCTACTTQDTTKFLLTTFVWLSSISWTEFGTRHHQFKRLTFVCYRNGKDTEGKVDTRDVS